MCIVKMQYTPAMLLLVLAGCAQQGGVENADERAGSTPIPRAHRVTGSHIRYRKTAPPALPTRTVVNDGKATSTRGLITGQAQ